MNISEFISWFISTFINLLKTVFNTWDNIEIASGVTLLDFNIGIFIIGIILLVLFTFPNASRMESMGEKVGRNEKRAKERQRSRR